MTIVPLFGHEDLRNRLAGAFASSRLPQALLLTGPSAVGKQRLALWLAQTVVCQRPGPDGPCDACFSCRHVVNLEHPDVHWFVPIERTPSTNAGNEVERAEQALAEIMQTRREARGLYKKPDGMRAHRLGSVRLLLRKLALRPATAERNVFIIGNADRLVSQDASPEAANALLKALEEPPAHTTFVLTSSARHALLPTIASRLIRLRVPRIPDAAVAEFLQTAMDPPLAEGPARKKAPSADGRIGTLIQDDGKAARQASRILEALRTPETRAAAALSQAPWSARGEFTETIDALAWSLHDKARRAAEKGNPIRRHILAMDAVVEARSLARRNVNPQLLLAELMEKLAEAR